jgi:hypothetical protein
LMSTVADAIIRLGFPRLSAVLKLIATLASRYARKAWSAPAEKRALRPSFADTVPIE